MAALLFRARMSLRGGPALGGGTTLSRTSFRKIVAFIERVHSTHGGPLLSPAVLSGHAIFNDQAQRRKQAAFQCLVGRHPLSSDNFTMVDRHLWSLVHIELEDHYMVG